MATNKAKRSIHLAQQAQQTRRSPNRLTSNNKAAELTPVKAHVYQSIAEMNAGLEKAIYNLEMLQSNRLFRSSGLSAMNRVLRGVRARTNRELMMTINEREATNAGQFEQLGFEVSELS